MSSKIPFHKIQGCGNDFVVCSIDDLPENFLSSQQKIRLICDRHFGVGSDGLLVVAGSESGIREVFMYNPDGSPMGMCGNGIRCVVRYLYLIHDLKTERSTFNFLVSGREIRCETDDCGLSVEVDMGPPSFDPKKIPINSDKEFRGEKLPGYRNEISGWALSMGNPHFVTFVNQIDDEVAKNLGADIELNDFFPKRTNVEFVRIEDPRNIEIRVWERGAGLTLACGTGACAAVVIGVLEGMLTSPCSVVLPGGSLQVKWDSGKENASVYLKGPALEVFSGSFDLS